MYLNSYEIEATARTHRHDLRNAAQQRARVAEARRATTSAASSTHWLDMIQTVLSWVPRLINAQVKRV